MDTANRPNMSSVAEHGRELVPLLSQLRGLAVALAAHGDVLAE
jgi:hypothetical protein